MKRKILLLNILIFACWSLSQGSLNLIWEEKNLDLGEVTEDSGEITGRFRFTNGEDVGIVVTDVRVSCGCTNIWFPDKEIAPADTASIVFRFNPEGRIGKFEKYLKVYTGKGGEYEKLTFKGTVKAGEKTISNRFPFERGTLRYETDHLKIGEMEKGERRHGFIGIYNASEQEYTPEFHSSTNGVEISVVPSTLQPGESGMIALYLNTAKFAEGLQEIRLLTLDGEGKERDDDVKISVIVLPKGEARIHK